MSVAALHKRTEVDIAKVAELLYFPSVLLQGQVRPSGASAQRPGLQHYSLGSIKNADAINKRLDYARDFAYDLVV